MQQSRLWQWRHRCHRIFAWAWSGHNNVRGFSYGSDANTGSQDSNDFLWEYGDENHAIPYTEVYIRLYDGSFPGVSGGSSSPEPEPEPEPGQVELTANGQTFTGFTEDYGDATWLLVGRSREGWTWKASGVHPEQVMQDLGTAAAFARAYYRRTSSMHSSVMRAATCRVWRFA